MEELRKFVPPQVFPVEVDRQARRVMDLIQTMAKNNVTSVLVADLDPNIHKVLEKNGFTVIQEHETSCPAEPVSYRISWDPMPSGKPVKEKCKCGKCCRERSFSKRYNVDYIYRNCEAKDLPLYQEVQPLQIGLH